VGRCPGRRLYRARPGANGQLKTLQTFQVRGHLGAAAPNQAARRAPSWGSPWRRCLAVLRVDSYDRPTQVHNYACPADTEDFLFCREESVLPRHPDRAQKGRAVQRLSVHPRFPPAYPPAVALMKRALARSPRMGGIMEGNEQITFPPLPRDGYPSAGDAMPALPPHRRLPARRHQRDPDRALPPGTSRRARSCGPVAAPRRNPDGHRMCLPAQHDLA
jgi:hypothetical protein